MYAKCIVGGCNFKVAPKEVDPSGRYCRDHERQRIYEDRLGKSTGKVRAWEHAQQEIRERERLSRRKKERADARKVATPEELEARKVRRRLTAARLKKRNRKAGLCACGKKPAKGKKNCRKCVRYKHPPGRPRAPEKKTLRSVRQKKYYRRCKRRRQCVHCVKEAYWDGFRGKYLTACYDHLTNADSSRIAKLKKRSDVREERLSRGEKLPGLDLDDSGDFHSGEALVVADEDAETGELSNWRTGRVHET